MENRYMTPEELNEMSCNGELKWLRHVAKNFPVMAPYYFNVCEQKYKFVNPEAYEPFKGLVFDPAKLSFEELKALVADTHKFFHHDKFNKNSDWATEQFEDFGLLKYSWANKEKKYKIKVGGFSFEDVTEYRNANFDKYQVWRRVCDYFGVNYSERFEKVVYE